jgi:hypothetical protein
MTVAVYNFLGPLRAKFCCRGSRISILSKQYDSKIAQIESILVFLCGYLVRNSCFKGKIDDETHSVFSTVIFVGALS